MDGSTPLFIACQANNKFASSVLIDRGADVRAKNIHGNQHKHVASCIIVTLSSK